MFKAIYLAILLASSPTWFQERSLVRLAYSVMENDSLEWHTCTGFMINASKGQVITARHCVPDEGDVLVDGIASEVILKDANFALVKVEPFSRPVLEFGKDPEIADRVITLGYGYGDLHRFDRHVSSLEVSDLEKKVHVTCGIIALDGPLAPGMSGGPILDANHKVIGLNQASAPTIGLGCDLKSIKKFLKEAK